MNSTKIHILILAGFLSLIGTQVYAQGTPWAAHVIDGSYDGADGVKTADVNGDGLMDFTTGFEEANVSVIYIHPGYEKVREPWPKIEAGQTPKVEDSEFADLDGDGYLDLISSCEDGNVYISWAPGDSVDYLDATKWKSEAIPASSGLSRYMFSIPIDMDGKNGIDFISGPKSKSPSTSIPMSGNIGWHESPINPRIIKDWKWHPMCEANWIMSLVAHDMDDDGDLDLATTDRRGLNKGLRWLENPGHGDAQKQNWTNHWIGPKGVEGYMFIDIIDLDGDGLDDIVVGEYTNDKVMFFKRMDKTGLNWTTVAIDLPKKATGEAKGIRVGDIDGNGTLDIVVSRRTYNDADFGIMWLTPETDYTNGTWIWKAISDPRERIFDRVELLDLDGDGDLDVLTADQGKTSGKTGYGVVWFENPHNVPVLVNSAEISNSEHKAKVLFPID